MQPENIPQELRSWPQWVCHDADKRPINAHTGQPASVTDPNTWATFDQACAAQAAGKGVGIGFVLTDHDPFAFIDLDVKPGEQPTEEQNEIFNESKGYAELSPSGRGLHIIVKGEVLSGRRRGNVEVYSSGRYMTMTGNVVRSGPIADCNLAPLYEHLGGAKAECSIPPGRSDPWGPPVTDDMAMTYLGGGSGENAAYYANNLLKNTLSDARFSVICSLAKATNGDRHQARRLFEASPLAQHNDPAKAMRDFDNHSWPKAAGRALAEHQQATQAAAHGAQIAAGLVQPASSQGTSHVVAPNPNRFKLLTGEELDRRGPIEWRIKGIAPKKGLFAIGGPSRSGKSNLAFRMAASLATGTDFFGHKVEACSVVYAGLEGAAGIPGRSKALRQHMQNDLSDFRVILQPVALNSEQDTTDLAAVCPKGSVVIIDTLSRATPGMDENSTKEMGAIIAATAKLSDLIDGLVVLVHHTGKDESKGLRGANDLIGALDGCIIVYRDGDNRKFKLDKVKDGEDGAFFGFKLETVVIGIDGDGEDITSCVVVPADLPTGKSAIGPKLSEGEKFLQKCFWEAFNEARKHDYGCGPNRVPISLWRQVFIKNSHLAQESKERTFRRDLGKLRDKGLILVENDNASALMPKIPIEGGAS